MTSDLIAKSQGGNTDAILFMIKKFSPLLKKYAYKLCYEDAYNDLLLDFIELLLNIRLDNIHNKNEENMVAYICKSVHNSFNKRLNSAKKLSKFIYFSNLSENEQYYTDAFSATYDKYFENELPFISSNLTKTEMSVLKMIYISGYTVKEIASICGISRQAVNQTKKRALKKIKGLLLDKHKEGLNHELNYK